MDGLGDTCRVGVGVCQPLVGKEERSFRERDRLADVVERRGQEGLPDGLDPIGERRQADRRGTVERVTDQGEAANDIGSRSIRGEVRMHGSPDLLAQDPELGHDRRGTEALVEPGLGVGLRGLRHRRVVEWARFLPVEAVGSADHRNDRVQQLRDVIRHGEIRSLTMERLAPGDAQPAVEDAGPLRGQRIGHRAKVDRRDDAVDSAVDVRGGMLAPCLHLLAIVTVRSVHNPRIRHMPKPPSHLGGFDLGFWEI